MIYLASPYSSPSEFVREHRYIAAKAATTWLLLQKRWVYSPIVHCHELAKTSDLPKDAAFWQNYNFAMLYRSSEIMIYKLSGWDDSKGVRGEAREAKRLGLSFSLIQPDNGDLLTSFHTDGWQYLPSVWGEL